MVKTQANIYIDAEIKELAKSKGINISRFCESALDIECQLSKDSEEMEDKETIEYLKKQNIRLLNALKTVNEELKTLKSKYLKASEKQKYIRTEMKSII